VQTKPEGVVKLWRVIHPHPESKILHPRACKAHTYTHTQKLRRRHTDTEKVTHL